MASQWYLQSDANGASPMTFDRLALLLAGGVVAGSDLVRNELESEWQPIESVIGLSRAADRLRVQAADDSIHQAEYSAADVSSHEPRPLADSTSDRSSQVPEPGTTSDATKTVPRSTSFGRRPISIKLTLAALLATAVVGWLGWRQWHEARRFPVPAHVRQTSSEWSLPWIGVVSGLEVCLLAFDTVVVVAFGCWWMMKRRR